MFENLNLKISAESVANLTKRELFAAMVMQGMSLMSNSWEEGSTIDEMFKKEVVMKAKSAVAYADALIAELETDKKHDK